jgi:DNA-binding NtrC family response regulator
MKFGIHSRELETAVELAQKLVSLDWRIKITTNKLDVVRMVMNRECDAVILDLSLNKEITDFIIEAIKSIAPEYPIILFGKGLPKDRYLAEKYIYYIDSPLGHVKLKETLNQIMSYLAENE